MIPDRELQELRDRIALKELIGRHVALKQKGREFSGICPFHNEKSPSFYVVPDKQMFHCFGCGAHGDAIGFVMRMLNLDFPAAVAHLRDAPMEAPAKREERRRQVLHMRESEIDAARRVLAESVPVERATDAGLYLFSRGIDLPQRGLRAHPSLLWSEPCDGPGDEQPGWRRWYSKRRAEWVRGREFGALIAPSKDSTGRVTAVQQIWCSERWTVGDGSKDSRAPVSIRKKTRGDLLDGCVRLAPAGPILGIAEGVETGCAAMQMTRFPTWVALGTSRLGFPEHDFYRTDDGPPERRPERPPSIWIPDGVERLVIFGDNGETGHLVADFAAWWFTREGLPATAEYPPSRHSDFDDWLMEQEGLLQAVA